MAMRRNVIAGAAAALAVGGAGAGVAATKLASSPSTESKAIVADAAKNLGVQPSKLSAAIKKALSDRVDKAVADGRLTKAQGAELKQRIASDEFPLFGPPAFGPGFGPPHPFFHGLDGAATYLGLTEAELRTRLNGGKTLAEIAKAHLSKAEAQRVLKGLDSRLDELVNGKLQFRFREHRGFGFHGRGFGFDRGVPPPVPGAAA